MAPRDENCSQEATSHAARHFLSLLLFFSATALLAAAQQPSPPQQLPTLTTIRDVRELAADKARLGYPIHLRAVVTYANKPERDLFVQDSTAGIFVNFGEKLVDFHSGQYVEIEGISGPGDFATEIVNPKLQIIGEAPLPEPVRISGDQFITGAMDSQFVEVAGIVKSASPAKGGSTLQLGSGAANIHVFIMGEQPVALGLVGARVRVQGVSGGDYNPRLQFLGAILLVPGLPNLTVEVPAPSDLFSIPIRPIHVVLRLSPSGAFSERVHVQGIVTLQLPGEAVYLGDGRDGLEAEARQTTPLEVGDLVDVVGFPAAGAFSPILQDAVYRKIGRDTPPPPALVTPEEALLGAHDSELIRIQGRVPDSPR